MSLFELSKEVNEKKIFLINHSELEDRFDAPFYWEDMDFSNCIKLSKIAKVSGGKRLPKGFDYSKETTRYRYLRIGNINWDSTLKYDKFKYISEELYTILNHYEIHKDDLLLAIVGATIGKCSILNTPNDDKIILTENCAKIKITDSDVLPHYLLFLLQTNFVQKQIQLNYVQTTLPKLGLDRVLSLYLPTPPSKEKQQEFLSIYQSAFLAKKQKEKQAKELLESIDTYLLNELGITLPEIDNSLEKRIFEVKLSDISGDRFDAPSNSQRFEFISKYNLKKFDDILFIDPSIGTIEEETLCTFLPMEKISDIYGEANINDNKYYKDSKGYTKFQDNDLLWSKITPCMQNGKSAVAENLNNNIGFGSTEYYVFRTKSDEINIKYIHSFLRLDILKKEAMKFFSGSAGHQRVSKSFFKSLRLPIPPIKKQNEIAEHIQNTRDKAKQLKLEAIQDLENAKTEVEKMILGS